MYRKLRDERKLQNVSSEKMKNLLGLKTNSAYYKKERGDIQLTLREAKIIADYFGKEINDIFFNEEPSKMDEDNTA